jgi:GAF domain-containing protein
MDSTQDQDSVGHNVLDRDPTSELATDISETVRILFGAGSVTDTLAEVVALAMATVEGCDFAGLFLPETDVVSAPVNTDAIVNEIDALQHESSEGPSLAAVAERQMFYADDVADDPRWTRFGPQAGAAGIRSILALPLTTNGNLGALNLYARYPAAFGVVDRAKGVILASLAGVAVSAAHLHEDENVERTTSTPPWPHAR